MARIKTKDGGDMGVVLDYLAPITGVQAISTSTSVAGVFDTAVALATIVAGDVVNVQLRTSSTLDATITYVTITTGTGFTVYLSKMTVGTLGYAVHHANAA